MEEGEAHREHRWLGLSRKSLSEKVTSEPTHDRRNGVSQVNLWGKTIKADRRANAKVLWKEHALSI